MSTLLRDPRALALLLAATLTIMANATISPSLPQLQALFSDQPNAAVLTPLLVTAPSLLVAILAPFAGLVADRFGRRKPLLIGVLLFGITGSAGLYLPSLPAIFVSRLALGLAVALIMTAQSALIGDYFSGEARGRFMGYQIAATNFGGFLCLTLAGWLATVSPRLPFAIYGVALLYVPVIWRAITDNPSIADSHHELSESPAAGGWPLMVTAIAALAGLTMMLFYVMPTQFPFFLSNIGHKDPSTAGVLLGALTLSGGIVALNFGAARARLGRVATPALGYLVMASGFVLLIGARELGLLLVDAMVIGGGFAFIIPSVFALMLDVVPENRRGVASGAITTSLFLGQFLSPLTLQPITELWGYAGLFGLAGGMLALLGVLVWFGLRPARYPSEQAG